jgi:hypothetical protein
VAGQLAGIMHDNTRSTSVRIGNGEDYLPSVSEVAKQKAQSVVQTFEKFIADNKDEITALQVLYSKPYKRRLTFKQFQELAQALELPHDGVRGLTPDVLWHAYETLDRSKVRGSQLTDHQLTARLLTRTGQISRASPITALFQSVRACHALCVQACPGQTVSARKLYPARECRVAKPHHLCSRT